MKQDQIQTDSSFLPAIPFVKKNEYLELKKLIKSKGLFEKQKAYYMYKIPITMTLPLLGIIFLLLNNNFWLQLLDAVYLGFTWTQLALLAHDAGHRQIARSIWKNDIWGYVVCLLIGSSYNAWVDKHNQHHSHPNHIDLDPDTKAPFFSFTEEQARSSRRLSRFIAKYEAYFLILFLSLLPVGILIHSTNFIVRKKGKYFPLEPILLGIHITLYFGILLLRLNPLQALLFFIVHQATFGLYAGSIFAPNHKGMLILDKESKFDFLHKQILTSRNIKSNLFVDIWYGGLNYQIEHHLFPRISRNKLREVQPIVKAFCLTHAIPYHETTILQSMEEIFHYVHRIGYPIRTK